MTADNVEVQPVTGASLNEVVERVQQISAENERLVRQLASGEDRFRRLARAVWQVQEEERRSLALELHDGVGQLLTALINHVQHSTGMDKQQADVKKAISLAESALAEVRSMSRSLRPSVLDDLGLEAALRWLIRTTAETSRLDVNLAWPDADSQPGQFTETLVFRVVQEALTNICKHARATRVDIAVTYHKNDLKVVIEDNGKGFDVREMLASSDRGFGVRGMRDRAELFGGVLAIESIPDSGTTVVLVVPDADA